MVSYFFHNIFFYNDYYAKDLVAKMSLVISTVD